MLYEVITHVDGGDQRTAGGQHRVDDHRQALVELADEVLEIRLRHQRLMVAGNADNAHLGVRNQVEHPVQHADAGAQDGHHGNLLALDLVDLDRATPAFDAHLLQLEIAAGLVGQQAGQSYNFV